MIYKYYEVIGGLLKKLGVIIPICGLVFLTSNVRLNIGESVKAEEEQHKSSHALRVPSAIIKEKEVMPIVKEKSETADAKEDHEIEEYFTVIFRGEKTSDKALNLIADVLKTLPEEHRNAPDRLVLRYDDPNAPRGLGGSSSIILRTIDVEDDEFVSLFVHELAHTVDLGHISGISGIETDFYDGERPIYSDDKSLDFYTLCWKNSYTQGDVCSDQDFVTGYAKTDAFEDFAESYLYYVLHGKEFRAMAEKSAILSKKYLFIKEIFDGREFETGDLRNVSSSRSWDATLVPLGEII